MRPDSPSGASSFYQVIDFNCGPILTFIVTYILSDSFAIHEPNLHGLRESPHPFRALDFYNSNTITITLLFFLHLIYIAGINSAITIIQWLWGC